MGTDKAASPTKTRATKKGGSQSAIEGIAFSTSWFPVSPMGLIENRAKAPEALRVAIRRAAERAYPAITNNRRGWAEHVEPTIEIIEQGFYERVQSLLDSGGSHCSSGMLSVRRDKSRGKDEDFWQFGLELSWCGREGADWYEETAGQEADSSTPPDAPEVIAPESKVAAGGEKVSQ